MIALTLLGFPGCGKSTVAKKVADILELELISSGDIARGMSNIDAQTRQNLESGNWAPEAAMRMEVLSRIEAATASTGDFIIEGFPRRLEQLYILESIRDIKPMYFVLDCNKLIAIRRIIARARKDDHPDAVATRIRSFEEFTDPLIDLLFDQTTYLDSHLPPDELADIIANDYRLQLKETNAA